jgi:hypothetical protein
MYTDPQVKTLHLTRLSIKILICAHFCFFVLISLWQACELKRIGAALIFRHLIASRTVWRNHNSRDLGTKLQYKIAVMIQNLSRSYSFPIGDSWLNIRKENPPHARRGFAAASYSPRSAAGWSSEEPRAEDHWPDLRIAPIRPLGGNC